MVSRRRVTETACRHGFLTRHLDRGISRLGFLDLGSLDRVVDRGFWTGILDIVSGPCFQTGSRVSSLDGVARQRCLGRVVSR